LLLESERVHALSKRVEDLEISLQDLETGSSGADTRLAALTAETMKLRQSEKELTAALRTMSQAEKSAKEKAQQLQRDLDKVHLTLASPPQRAASGEEDEEMSLGRASMPVEALWPLQQPVA